MTAFLTLSAATLPGTLELSFDHLRSTKGVLRICLTTNPKAFPDCSKDKTAITRTVKASEGKVEFTGIPAGDYAVAIIHDENTNAKLDTFAGIPREGVGFSRNPRLVFGAPSFASARFAIGTAQVDQLIEIKYFL